MGARTKKTEVTVREEQQEVEAQQTEDAKESQVETEEIDGIVAEKCDGTIKMIFDGVLRVRTKPSWGNDAVKGVMRFDTKKVTHKLTVDGKVMYKTLDGYFVSGDTELVEYIETER